MLEQLVLRFTGVIGRDAGTIPFSQPPGLDEMRMHAQTQQAMEGSHGVLKAACPGAVEV